MLKYTLMTNKPTTSILLLNESCTKLQLQSIRDVNQGLEFRLRIPKFDVLRGAAPKKRPMISG